MPSTFDEDRSPKIRSDAGLDPREALWDAPVEVLRGAESVNRMVIRLFKEARRELLMFVGRPMLGDADVAEAFRDLQQRGVIVRQILPREFLESGDAECRSFVDSLQNSLASTGRQADQLPGKLAVIDGRIGLVSLTSHAGAGHQAVVLRQRNLVLHLRASFEQHWERAAPVSD